MTTHALQLDDVTGAMEFGAVSATGWLLPMETRRPDPCLLAQMIGQYYFVNRAFVLGIVGYASRLCLALREHAESCGMTRAELEDVLAVVVKISADECQVRGVHAGANIHHNVLLRMGPKLGLLPGDIHQVSPTQETKALVQFIEAQLLERELFDGLATVSAVESIALPMITSLRRVFVRFESTETGARFDNHELAHFDLHIELEAEHAAETMAIYQQVELDSLRSASLVRTARATVAAFGAFWEQFIGDPHWQSSAFAQ